MPATFVVEDGTGLSDANSYATEAEADQYHLNYGNPVGWSGLSSSDKQTALRLATQAISGFFGGSWRGYRAKSTQALDWPRLGVFTRDLHYVPCDTVPKIVKDATAILALASRSETLMPDQATPAAIKRKKTKAGPVEREVEYVGGLRSQKGYTLVCAILEPLLADGSIVRG